jgi:hypothetical protein
MMCAQDLKFLSIRISEPTKKEQSEWFAGLAFEMGWTVVAIKGQLVGPT